MKPLKSFVISVYFNKIRDFTFCVGQLTAKLEYELNVPESILGRGGV